jgi:hypothetical protein
MMIILGSDELKAISDESNYDVKILYKSNINILNWMTIIITVKVRMLSFKICTLSSYHVLIMLCFVT